MIVSMVKEKKVVAKAKSTKKVVKTSVLSPHPVPVLPKIETPDSVMKSEVKLKEFKCIRIKCRDHLKTEMYQDLKDVKNLDDHILEYVKVAKEDIKKHNLKDVQNVTKEFENEIYEELYSVIKNANEDLDLLKKILTALNKLKQEVDFKNEPSRLIGLEKYEMRFAEAIIDGAKSKLDETKKTFDRLKKEGF